MDFDAEVVGCVGLCAGVGVLIVMPTLLLL